MDFGPLFLNRMISVQFELEWVEFGMLIPGIPSCIPLPEKYQKECSLGKQVLYISYKSSKILNYEREFTCCKTSCVSIRHDLIYTVFRKLG